jgi:hypothetical protein
LDLKQSKRNPKKPYFPSGLARQVKNLRVIPGGFQKSFASLVLRHFPRAPFFYPSNGGAW